MTVPAAPRTDVLRAAGGLVWRRGPDEVEVVLVHRRQYDDWSFPKGKVDDGETDEQAAVREVEEEAGVICRLGAELASSSYTDSTGRPKVVRYWVMTVQAGTVAGAHEIDRAEWVPLSEVRERMSYARDHGLVDGLEAAIGAASGLTVRELDHLVINVADVERSLAWYTGLLGLPGVRVDEWRRGAAPFPSVRIAEGTIVDILAAPRADANVDHFCLVVEPTDLAAVAASGSFEVVDGPDRRYGARGDGTSLY
ncbi:MAG: NUDIX domain-containing protein, partial [Actinomycetes bacterium]